MKPTTIRGMLATILAFTFLAAGCGQDMPFDYKYLSANQVRVDYSGKSYLLNRFGPRVNTPFDYAFEADGDLDITIGGKTWDLDSPYDIDKPKSKKKKKKKTTTSKKTKRKK